MYQPVISRILRGVHSVFVLSVLLLTGCGESGPETAAVKGTVTFNGQPVEQGMIVFQPDEGSIGPSAGGPISNGSFSIDKRKGPPLGPVRIEITATRKEGTLSIPNIAGQTSGGPTGGGTVDKIVMYIPKQYNTETTLKEFINPKVNEFQFDLTSKP